MANITWDLKNLDSLKEYIFKELIGEHKNTEDINEAINKYAESYHEMKLKIELKDVDSQIKQESWDVPEGLKFMDGKQDYQIIINERQVVRCYDDLYDVNTYNVRGNVFLSNPKDYKIIRCEKEDIKKGEICFFDYVEDSDFNELVKYGYYGFVLGNGELLEINIDNNIHYPEIMNRNWDYWFKIVKR